MLTLVENRPEAAEQRLLRFDAVPQGYTTPGQFIVATTGDRKPGYFAIASSPGKPLELLLKAAGPTAEAICALEAGASFEASAAQGPGFAMERAAGCPLVIVVTGTGLAAVRALVAAEVAAGLPRPVTLLYGYRTAAHQAFGLDLALWERAGVRVQRVLSDGTAGPTRVQALAADALTADCAVVLVGQRGLAEDVRALCEAKGIPAERVLTNF